MSLPWFKFNPKDFLDGTFGLTAEEKGVYITVLAMIYQRGQAIPDEPRWIAGNCLISVRLWSKIRAALIVKGKLYVTDDGALMNGRAGVELGTAAKQNRAEAEPSPADEDKPVEKQAAIKENKGLDGTDIDREGDREEGAKAPLSPRGDALPVREAFDAWNFLAKRIGLPVAQTLTDDRRRKIRARLAAAGFDAWREALAAVEASSLCRGDNERGWRADLDFVCQPKSFNRLREGAYAGKPNQQAPPAVVPELSAEWHAQRIALIEKS